MDGTLEALSRVGRFARAMAAETPLPDEALPHVRSMFSALGTPFLIVGGVALIHHGYVRATEDIYVLVDPAGLALLSARAAEHGFSVVRPRRLRHDASGVVVDLLVAGEPMPRPGAPLYPEPDGTRASPRDPTVAGLPLLCELKLRAHRHADVGDVVELLKRISEQEYLALEVETPSDLRLELASLRRDALEEASFQRG